MTSVISASSSIFSCFFIFITVLSKLSGKQNIFNLALQLVSYHHTSLETFFMFDLVEINEGDRFPLKKYQELNYQDFKFSDGSNDPTTSARFKRDTSLMDAPVYRTNRLQFTAFNR